MTKPFEATKELLESIEHDQAEAKDVAEWFLVGIAVPILLVPPVAIADILRAPIDIIREFAKKRKED